MTNERIKTELIVNTQREADALYGKDTSRKRLEEGDVEFLYSLAIRAGYEDRLVLSEHSDEFFTVVKRGPPPFSYTIAGYLPRDHHGTQMTPKERFFVDALPEDITDAKFHLMDCSATIETINVKNEITQGERRNFFRTESLIWGNDAVDYLGAMAKGETSNLFPASEKAYRKSLSIEEGKLKRELEKLESEVLKAAPKLSELRIEYPIKPEDFPRVIERLSRESAIDWAYKGEWDKVNTQIIELLKEQQLYEKNQLEQCSDQDLRIQKIGNEIDELDQKKKALSEILGVTYSYRRVIDRMRLVDRSRRDISRLQEILGGMK